MRFTETLGLPCPDATDHAALALYMQRLAEAVEAEVLSRLARVESVLDPPAALWANVVAVPAISSAQTALLSFGAADLEGANYSPAVWTAAAGMFPGPGIWHVGYHINAVETGAITADSLRTADALVRRYQSNVPTNVQDFSRRTVADGLAGGAFWGCDAVVSLGADYADYGLSVVFSHANAASTMQIPIGGARAWMYRVGASDPIEVV